MGLSSTTNRVSYTGNGSSTVFSFPYYFFSQSDLSVYLYDTGSSIVYPQTLNTNYSVSGSVNQQGVYPSGGNVVMASSFPLNLQLIITRNPAQIQNYVLNQNQPINSQALVQQVDYLTALVQRLQDEVSRTIQLPDGLGQINGVAFSQILPQSLPLIASAGQVLTVNSGASGWTLSTVTGGGGSIAAVSAGGTGQGGALTAGSVIYAASPTQMLPSAVGTPGQVLTSAGAGAPTWQTASASGSGPVNLQTASSILAVSNGGLGQGSPFTQGGILWGSSPTTASITAAGSVGQVLTAQGSSAPTWQTISASGSGPTNLVTASGVLAIANGGTGTTILGAQPFGLPYIASASALGTISSAAPGSVLLAKGSSSPVFEQMNLASSVQFTGVLPITSGGTGVSSSVFNALSPITSSGQIIIGSGTSIQSFAFPIGTANQVLSVNAAGTGLVWTTASVSSSQVAFNYYAGAITGATWSTTSATFADPVVAGSSLLTQRTGNMTVSTPITHLPAITFTPTAGNSVYRIVATFQGFNDSAAGDNAGFAMTDGTKIITTGGLQSAALSNGTSPLTLNGIYAVLSASSVTIKIQGSNGGAGTCGWGQLNVGSGAVNMEWNIQEII